MKLLWIKSDFLYPADSGGKIRSYNILRQLSRKHKVNYVCLAASPPASDHIEHLLEFCSKVEYVIVPKHTKFSPLFYFEIAVGAFSRRPFVINTYTHYKIQNIISTMIRSGDVDVLICDFLAMAANALGEHAVPKVLFQHNVEAEIWRRHYQTNSNPLAKAYLFMDYLKMKRFEHKACASFDRVLAVSHSDLIFHKKNYEIEHIDLIPTGVDADYFKPGNGSVKPQSMVFVGSMSWLPNIDAIEYFISEILPKIKIRYPNSTFTIVGKNPPEKIITIGKSDSTVRVTGAVDDVRPYVEAAAVYVVPIRIGGGTRIKIFEALAQKKAIVSTRIGAEGLPVCDGREIMLRDSPEEFANAVCELFKNERLCNSLGNYGRDLVVDNYTWETVANHFAKAIESAASFNHEYPLAIKCGDDTPHSRRNSAEIARSQ
jgi:glycosyltransferase involved in cell wall biosynthesis